MTAAWAILTRTDPPTLVIVAAGSMRRPPHSVGSGLDREPIHAGEHRRVAVQVIAYNGQTSEAAVSLDA